MIYHLLFYDFTSYMLRAGIEGQAFVFQPYFILSDIAFATQFGAEGEKPRVVRLNLITEQE